MNLNKYLKIAPNVQKALDEGRPVIALESTIISHGMPYPKNVETALNVEKIISARNSALLLRWQSWQGRHSGCPHPYVPVK